jgi:membrane-associated phospholipid phosphatase
MSLRPFTILVTSFGGQAVILPILVLVTLMLLVSGQKRAAFWWAFSVALVLGLVLVTKIAFIPCSTYLPVPGLRSPSGHAGAAMAVYGGLGVLVARLVSSLPLRGLLVGSGVLLALAIAVTRVILGAHTLPETILGALIGVIAPLILASRTNLFVGPVRLRWIWLLAGPLVLVVLFHGFELGAESVIERVAHQLNLLLGVCR